MNFVKLQGTGNDFILIDARSLERDWAAVARDMCHRHFGVGADGLLLILPSETADLHLQMFNPDGSEAEACGNGLRCFAKYAVESGLVGSAEFMVETLAGTRSVRTQAEKGVQVAMGIPTFDPTAIPVIVERRDKQDPTPVVDYPITIGDSELRISCVSMGNPHAVCFLDEPITDFPLAQVGPRVEHHHMFPNRVNFAVANVISQNEIRARVWERGAGETLSCGSGACAIAVTAQSKGLIDNRVDIGLPGGTLTVDWNGVGEVLLSGPAEVVFYGVWKD
ncbi:MAG: diaminopimelate epimerase [Dehalococcoidia bacterium]|nr:MAG: diaminopimelate epimerase [Dehalococcoidia bacterium]